MADDNKWDNVTAAIAAFAEDPLVDGIGMGLQFFPLGDECSDSGYATPAVPIQLLPGNATAIKAALAAHQPNGDTPTLPALRGALEYARASLMATPTRDVIVVLATDGDPDTCDSTANNVAAAAAEGLSTSPQVLTAVIGIEHGNANALAQIAAAGGAGMPIPVGSGPTAAQQFVDALRTIRDNEEGCRFAIPAPTGATVEPSDVGIVYTAPGTPPTLLARVTDMSACSMHGGFFVDDPNQPKSAILCPGTCQVAHMSPGSTVAVSAGCGAGSPPPGMMTDGGLDCGGAIEFDCLPQCGSKDPPVAPICVNGNWACPPGTVSTDECTSCQPVPHGCCLGNGMIGTASCLNGAWTCPPGGQLFGAGTCQPPAACAASLPCPLNQFCQVPDGTCGVDSTSGTCKPLPTNCPPGGPPACACGGQVFPNSCAAAAAGLDVSAGGCPAPAGTFACGSLFCNIADEICTKTAVATGIAYGCVAKLPNCATGCEPTCPSYCGCPLGKICGFCGVDTTGGAILNCP
jgi:hypothetical protein